MVRAEQGRLTATRYVAMKGGMYIHCIIIINNGAYLCYLVWVLLLYISSEDMYSQIQAGLSHICLYKYMQT